ncbi:MAG: SufD family Fe-S cluster assembly protein [Deltaproteobacteria bacterium]|nr:SufD family Fe-S cluster assembly protein [Deltaproteobacteria bacterium]
MHKLDKKATNIPIEAPTFNQDVDLKRYSDRLEEHSYVDDLAEINTADTEQMLKVGVDTRGKDRAGTFIQKDSSVLHCKAKQDGVEVMGISQAIKKHDWLKNYLWKGVSPDADKYTLQAKLKPTEGYFIRVLPGVKTEYPIQSCLYIAKEDSAQNVHNIVIAEEGSELHIITGCATAPHVVSGLHVGVSEFYIKKGAKLTFTMIHNWGKDVAVRPRTVAYVEEDGVLVSNYISLKHVRTLQMYPTTFLNGKGAVARFSSVLVAPTGSHLDIGSRVVLNAPETRAEIISRAITTGGTIIARGHLTGKYPGVKAHLECKGLILSDGLIHAIPELEGHVAGVEMSHEAAVGKIAREEIEYLMARGLDEEAAISTIVRGFLNVDIEGLPPSLKKELDIAIAESEKDMF